MTPQPAALEEIEAIVDRGGDADDVLRAVVAALHEHAGYSWAGILFVEDGGLALGPEAGNAAANTTRTGVPVTWQGERVAEREVEGADDADRPFLQRVAQLVSGHCLVGWDTGGEPWDS
jgi:putative methionine-R-sulfoxide reductase with GAF domain